MPELSLKFDSPIYNWSNWNNDLINKQSHLRSSSHLYIGKCCKSISQLKTQSLLAIGNWRTFWSALLYTLSISKLVSFRSGANTSFSLIRGNDAKWWSSICSSFEFCSYSNNTYPNICSIVRTIIKFIFYWPGNKWESFSWSKRICFQIFLWDSWTID